MEHQTLFSDSNHHHLDEQEIREQISFYERRLLQIGDLADSACEKLLVRAYRELLQQRQELLDDLLVRRRCVGLRS